ncbi:MAG: hypothetical protein HQL22_12230 [Candidatus Omnitrophica bacterium]|nr:hypothetical protein [Candidatus Omnitrophota bacterium]
MFKYHLTGLFIVMVLLSSKAVYGQGETQDRKSFSIVGTVTTVDTVAGVINVQTDNGPMAFSVSEKAQIVRDTHDIGLLDIKPGHPVTIQYETPSPGKSNVISLVDNMPSNQ